MNSLTNSNISEAFEDMPTVIKVYAPWCQPCHRLDPIMKELETEYENRVKFLSLDTDDQQDLAGEFRISSIPTIIFMKNGVKSETLIGVRSKKEIAENIEEMLK